MNFNTYDMESIGAISSPLADQIVATAARARDMRIAASKALQQRPEIATEVVRLVGVIKKSKDSGAVIGNLGEGEWWNPLTLVSTVASGLKSAGTFIAEKATEVVTGISADQIKATEKQTAWEQKAIPAAVAQGTMTVEQGAQLTQLSQQAAADAKAASSATNVLVNTAKIAANTANNALGDPLGTIRKYGTYAAIGGGALLALILYMKVRG